MKLHLETRQRYQLMVKGNIMIQTKTVDHNHLGMAIMFQRCTTIYLVIGRSWKGYCIRLKYLAVLLKLMNSKLLLMRTKSYFKGEYVQE